VLVAVAPDETTASRDSFMTSIPTAPGRPAQLGQVPPPACDIDPEKRLKA
jgi:hypothetical protein